MINMNKSNGFSSGRILNEPMVKPLVNACIPTQRLVDAMPNAAKLPDFL